MALLQFIGIVVCVFLMDCGLDLHPFIVQRIKGQDLKIATVSLVYFLAIVIATCWLVGLFARGFDFQTKGVVLFQVLTCITYIAWIWTNRPVTKSH